MALRPVKDIKLFKATTGQSDVDYLLNHKLLHLELEVETTEKPFVMSGIPNYIGKTLLEHTHDLPYSFGFLTLLNEKRVPGNPFKRVERVDLNIKTDNKNCVHKPLKLLLCDCGECTAIDMSTYLTLNKSQHNTDIYSGLLLSVMYNAPITLNNNPIQHITVVQIKNKIALSIDYGEKIFLLNPPEPVIAFFSHFAFKSREYKSSENRLSIEALTMFLSKEKAPVNLNYIAIAELQDTGTYAADVEFNIGEDTVKFRMIPSHALLLSFLLNSGNIYVDELLLNPQQ